MVRGKAGNTTAPPPQAPPLPSELKKLAQEGEKLADAMVGKAENPETPGAGHNSKVSMVLTDPDEQSACYFEITKEATRISSEEKKLKEALKALSEAKKQVFKTGKARLPGFNRKDFEFGIALKSSLQSEDGGSAALEEHRRRLRIAAWEEHPIATEPDMFGDEKTVDRTPSVERAYHAGKLAGGRGDSCSPPSALGQAQAQEWMRGWHVGQDGLMKWKRTQQTTAPTEGGLWPDDRDVNGAPTPDEVSNVVPIGTAPSTAEAL